MFKKIRIAILLLILFIVGADTYMTKIRSVSWDETLWVGIYPINPNNDPEKLGQRAIVSNTVKSGGVIFN